MGKGSARLSCKKKGCPQKVSKFGFCVKHFAEFKFGLITKHGELAPDYDKKLSHYERFKKGA